MGVISVWLKAKGSRRKEIVMIPVDKCPAPYAPCLAPRQYASPEYWADTNELCNKEILNMPSMNRQDVEKALDSRSGAPIVRYNRSSGTFTIMNVFFKTMGQVGIKTLTKRLKRQIPGAEILSAWSKNKESQCGFECVEFRVWSSAVIVRSAPQSYPLTPDPLPLGKRYPTEKRPPL